MSAPVRSERRQLVVPDAVRIRILIAEFMTIDARWDTANVSSTFWRFYVNDRDGAWVSLGRERFDLPGGRVVLIPPWVRFSCHCDRPVGHLYAHFDWPDLPPAWCRTWFTRPIALGVDEPIAPLAAPLRSRLSQPAVDVAALCWTKAAVLLAVGRLLEMLPPAQAQQCSRSLLADHPLAPALQLIEQRLREPPTNAELARACRLSEDHFIHRFRQSIGQTPARYGLDRRIAHAAERLLLTADSVDQIAVDVGFADRFSFSRAFKRVMGTGPATYRRRDRV